MFTFQRADSQSLNRRETYLAFKKVYMHLQGTEKGFAITFSKGSILKRKLCVCVGGGFLSSFHQGNFESLRFVFALTVVTGEQAGRPGASRWRKEAAGARHFYLSYAAGRNKPAICFLLCTNLKEGFSQHAVWP